ncbi:hypothetical protein [Mucilaginibacter antarcticus]|uniref:hypothetical protein n=1 Tax=Mucilaginibacter antarcticus TaxID=1855725 RepID=UPI00363E2E6A
MKGFAATIFAVLLLSACSGGGTDYSPKPRGFYRIDFPKKSTRIINRPTLLHLNIRFMQLLKRIPNRALGQTLSI